MDTQQHDRRRPLGRVASIAGIATIAVAMAAGPSAAAGSLDQAQPDGGTCHGTGDMFGQTFTAGVTGQLDQIDVLLFSFSQEPITLEVRSVGNDGFPTDAVLATATIPSEQIPPTTSHPFLPDEVVPGVAEVSVPVGPVPVVAGTQYAYVLRRAPLELFACGDTGDPYAAGQQVHHFGGQWSGPAGDMDLLFRTYVSPPPPPAPAPDGVLSGVLTGVTNLVPALAPVVQPIKNLLRGLGL